MTGDLPRQSGCEPQADSQNQTGGQILVSALLDQGMDKLFCVPGESYLAVLDALYDVRDRCDVIACRQEGGAAVMAEAYGKLMGRPGICFVTRGPGATNASIAVHTARQDSTPMILFIGHVTLGDRDREAFQEIDYRRMFGPLAKWVAEIEDARRIPEYLSRAYATAMNGRPGPVVLVLPEDILTAVHPAPERMLPVKPVVAAPTVEDITQFSGLLSRAERPLMILGGSGWTAEARDLVQDFAEKNHIPVALSFRRQALFDNDHPNYVGDVGLGINPALAERITQADLLIVVGARLSENMTQGYRLLSPPRLRQLLVHVHPGADELGKVFAPALAIQSSPFEFARAISDHTDPLRGTDWLQGARLAYEDWTRPTPSVGPVNLADIMVWLRKNLPENAIITNGAGNYTIWLHRFYRYRGFLTQLAPTSGAMGYGVPAAIGAKAVYPDRTVVSFAGDGCFLMNGQELATAVQYNLNILFIIVNNSMYGTIRMHQEREYPARVMATDLRNPDFIALAQAYGAYAERVRETSEFADAFGRAMAAGRPAVIEIQIAPEDLTPNQTLSDIRKSALL